MNQQFNNSHKGIKAKRGILAKYLLASPGVIKSWFSSSKGLATRDLVFVTIIILILYPHSHSAFAQCPMCRMSAESNMANGGGAGKGLNTGILYLLVFPYLLAAVMIYLFRKNRKKLEQG